MITLNSEPFPFVNVITLRFADALYTAFPIYDAVFDVFAFIELFAQDADVAKLELIELFAQDADVAKLELIEVNE